MLTGGFKPVDSRVLMEEGLEAVCDLENSRGCDGVYEARMGRASVLLPPTKLGLFGLQVGILVTAGRCSALPGSVFVSVKLSVSVWGDIVVAETAGSFVFYTSKPAHNQIKLICRSFFGIVQKKEIMELLRVPLSNTKKTKSYASLFRPKVGSSIESPCILCLYSPKPTEYIRKEMTIHGEGLYSFVLVDLRVKSTP